MKWISSSANPINILPKLFAASCFSWNTVQCTLGLNFGLLLVKWISVLQSFWVIYCVFTINFNKVWGHFKPLIKVHSIFYLLSIFTVISWSYIMLVLRIQNCFIWMSLLSQMKLKLYFLEFFPLLSYRISQVMLLILKWNNSHDTVSRFTIEWIGENMERISEIVLACIIPQVLCLSLMLCFLFVWHAVFCRGAWNRNLDLYDW